MMTAPIVGPPYAGPIPHRAGDAPNILAEKANKTQASLSTIGDRPAPIAAKHLAEKTDTFVAPSRPSTQTGAKAWDDLNESIRRDPERAVWQVPFYVTNMRLAAPEAQRTTDFFYKKFIGMPDCEQVALVELAQMRIWMAYGLEANARHEKIEEALKYLDAIVDKYPESFVYHSARLGTLLPYLLERLRTQETKGKIVCEKTLSFYNHALEDFATECVSGQTDARLDGLEELLNYEGNITSRHIVMTKLLPSLKQFVCDRDPTLNRPKPARERLLAAACLSQLWNSAWARAAVEDVAERIFALTT